MPKLYTMYVTIEERLLTKVVDAISQVGPIKSMVKPSFSTFPEEKQSSIEVNIGGAEGGLLAQPTGFEILNEDGPHTRHVENRSPAGKGGDVSNYGTVRLILGYMRNNMGRITTRQAGEILKAKGYSFNTGSPSLSLMARAGLVRSLGEGSGAYVLTHGRGINEAAPL